MVGRGTKRGEDRATRTLQACGAHALLWLAKNKFMEMCLSVGLKHCLERLRGGFEFRVSSVPSCCIVGRTERLVERQVIHPSMQISCIVCIVADGGESAGSYPAPSTHERGRDNTRLFLPLKSLAARRCERQTSVRSEKVFVKPVSALYIHTLDVIQYRPKENRCRT